MVRFLAFIRNVLISIVLFPLRFLRGRGKIGPGEEPAAPTVEQALAEVGRLAGGDHNLLPPMREALRVEATVGEVCEVLRGSWGTYDAHGAHG